MRIGIDGRLWNESGVGRYIRNLVKHLSELDVKNEYVLFLRKEEFSSSKLKAQSSKLRKVLADVRWHTLKEQLLFPKILAKEKLDLVHFPYFSVPIFCKTPFVVTIHDLTIAHFPTGKASTLPYPVYFLKHLGYRVVLNQAIKRAKKVIVPSKATKKEILEHFKISEKKIRVTYEGVNFSQLDKRPRLKFTKSKLKKGSYFLYVGNAYPHKNLGRLLEAFQSTVNPGKAEDLRRSLDARDSSRVIGPRSMHRGNQQSTIKDLRLVLVGREDFFYKRLEEKVKKMGLQNKVIFYGRASDQELRWLYQNALALILPSLMEGFGLPALEAMACGCLVLASNIPALREVCQEAAIYFDPDKVEKIAGALFKATDFNSISKYSRKRKLGRQRAKMFSWKKMAEETLKVYENCLC